MGRVSKKNGPQTRPVLVKETAYLPNRKTALTWAQVAVS